MFNDASLIIDLISIISLKLEHELNYVEQDMQCTCNVTLKPVLCLEKAIIIITYSECVFVALGFHHA